jgi:hypothetical protein
MAAGRATVLLVVLLPLVVVGTAAATAGPRRRELVAMAPPEPRTVVLNADTRREVRLFSFGFLAGGSLNLTLHHYQVRPVSVRLFLSLSLCVRIYVWAA